MSLKLNISKTYKQDLLMSSLQKFYLKKDNILKIKRILHGKSKISLRIIDWFVTNYSKKKNINYMINIPGDNVKKEKQFIVYIDYKLQLKGYSKKQFDPFCRRERINFYYEEDNYVVTTVGQLNFFRWAISNKIIEYIEKNLKEIETDMNQSMKNVYKIPSAKKSKNRKKRNALSVSATRTVNKHNVKIVVSFD
jgi:hypothetical protein